MEYLVRLISGHVWDSLGPGYSERVYHNAFEVALRMNSVNYETERIIPIFFQGHNIGNVRADLILDQHMIVELKSVTKIKEENRNQIKNYMRLTGLSIGMLVNFPSVSGPIEIEVFKKLISDNSNGMPGSGSTDGNTDGGASASTGQ